VGLMLALNRKICLADQKVHGYNFSLDGLIGFDMFGKTAGIIGAGNIGKVAVQILRGFGMKVLIYDIVKDEAFAKAVGAEYIDLNTLLAKSDIVSLHTPLTKETHYLISKKTLSKMKEGAMLINTGRGGLVNTLDLIEALKSKKLSCAGLDVYEKESGYFFEDCSKRGVDDPVLLELLSLPNVLITAHQGFFTREAMQGIAEATLKSVSDFSQNRALVNEVTG
jgi:D-lactate dehydrogenase